MAISFIASTVADSGSSTSSTCTLNTPAGCASGDVLVAQLVVVSGTNRTVTPPAGFTSLVEQNATTVLKNHTFYRVCDGSEGASFAFGINVSSRFAASMVCYRGVDNVTPFDVTTGTSSVAATGTVTTVTNGAVILSVLAPRSTVGAIGGTITPDAATIERTDTGNNAAVTSTWFGSSIDDETQATAGTTTARTATSSQTIASWLTQTIALRPVGGGTATAADTVTVSDAATRAATYPRTGSDSDAISDAAVRTRTAARTGSDTDAVSDAATRTPTTARTASDTISVSDTATISGSSRTATDSVSITDADVRTTGANRTVTDASTVSDAVTRVRASTRTSSDTSACGDLTVRTMLAPRFASTTIAISDIASTLRAGPRAANDALVITDFATVVGDVHIVRITATNRVENTITGGSRAKTVVTGGSRAKTTITGVPR